MICLRILTMMMAVAVFAAQARAADEFGARFSQQEPAALADPAQASEEAAAAEAMQNIEPAAGDAVAVPGEVDPEALADKVEAGTAAGPGIVAKKDMTDY